MIEIWGSVSCGLKSRTTCILEEEPGWMRRFIPSRFWPFCIKSSGDCWCAHHLPLFNDLHPCELGFQLLTLKRVRTYFLLTHTVDESFPALILLSLSWSWCSCLHFLFQQIWNLGISASRAFALFQHHSCDWFHEVAPKLADELICFWFSWVISEILQSNIFFNVLLRSCGQTTFPCLPHSAQGFRV